MNGSREYFIYGANIARFKRQILGEQDEKRRTLLLELLADEHRKAVAEGLRRQD